MAQIRIGETNFYYEYSGKGNPLVLISGYACDHTFWEAMHSELTQHFQVLTFDNRGIGQTIDLTSPLTLELMAEDTIQLIRTLGLNKPIVLGQSMGGAIAQIVAKKYSDEISKLIILNSASKINQRTVMTLESLLNIFKENVTFDTLIEASMPWFYSAQYLSHPKNIALYKEICKNDPYPPTVEILMRQLSALKQFNSQPWVNTLNLPTLVIASEDDIICLPSESAKLAKSLAHAEFKLIQGGHASPIENPTGVTQAILNF